ncbi:SDR family oxidoreductase [Angustibacter aerolatus]
MRVAVAGGHGQVARRLTRLLHARGDEVLAIVRDPDHVADVEADGATAVLLDLERAAVDELAAAVRGCDAVVFSAGAGPGSGDERKGTVDHGAAVLLADAAEAAGVPRYQLVSSTGVESVRDGAVPEGLDDGFLVYLRAKLAAEDDLRARTALDWLVLRPGRLTDEPGTGLVHLAPNVRRGDVSRDDVAAVQAELLHRPGADRSVLELVGGEVPVAQAVEGVGADPDRP